MKIIVIVIWKIYGENKAIGVWLVVVLLVIVNVMKEVSKEERMLINKKAVKQYFRNNNKKIGKRALGMLDKKVVELCDKIIRINRFFKTVKAEEIAMLKTKLEI